MEERKRENILWRKATRRMEKKIIECFYHRFAFYFAILTVFNSVSVLMFIALYKLVQSSSHLILFPFGYMVFNLQIQVFCNSDLCVYNTGLIPNHRESST